MNYYFLFVIVILVSLTACGDDDEISCVTCNSDQTITFNVCEENDGNASVNGENTNTPFSLYIEGLREAGATCGE